MGENNFKIFWDEAYNQIKNQYISQGKEKEFSLWFNINYVEDTMTEIFVSVPSPFFWTNAVNKGYVNQLENKISELSGVKIPLKYINKKDTDKTVPITNTQTVTINESKTVPIEKQKIQNKINSSNGLPLFSALNDPESFKEKLEIAETLPKTVTVTDSTVSKNLLENSPMPHKNYIFENFVTSDNTNFAYGMAMAAAKQPGKKYSPLVFYGASGLGKTHLMESIGNYIYTNSDTKKLKILYISSENFVNEFIFSLQNTQMEKFTHKYRTLDVFLLDDIHNLINKDDSQEVLFNIYEALEQRHSQMVFTCDRPIKELTGFAERLKSRLLKGTPICLQPPSFETRCAILRKKMQERNAKLSNDVIEFIAKNVQSNIRTLESCLDYLLKYADLSGQNITVELAQREISDMLSDGTDASISIDLIQKIVAQHYDISVEELKSSKKTKKISNPRHIAVYISKKLTENSLQEIGNSFGKKDHTTIMNSVKKIKESLKIDPDLNSTIEMLIRQIRENSSS